MHNEMMNYLQSGDNAGVLMGCNALGNKLTREVRVNGKPFPISPTKRCSSEGSGIRSQQDIDYIKR